MADDAGGKRAGSIGGLLLSLGTIVIAVGAGAAFTAFMHPSLQSAPAGEKPGGDHTALQRPADKKAAQGATDAAKEHVLPLETVIANIDSADKSWVRLDAFVSFQVPPTKDEQALLLRQMSEDLLGFLRSSSLSQLETAAGFEFLREDLSELVRLRSKGRAQRLIIKSLVVE